MSGGYTRAAAWGAHGGHLGQDQTVLGWISPKRMIHALGMTKGGFPRHPLYMPSNTKPMHIGYGGSNTTREVT